MPNIEYQNEQKETMAQQMRIIGKIQAAEDALVPLREQAGRAAAAVAAAGQNLKNLPQDAATEQRQPLMEALTAAQKAQKAANEGVRQAEQDQQDLTDYLSRLPGSAKNGNSVSKESPWTMIVSFSLVGIILAAVMWPRSPLLSSLTAVDTARGLVTFLVTASTAAIAFMLIFHAFTPSGVPERFRMAREIFTALVGILGTIIGYYFGVPKDTAAGAPPAIEVISSVYDAATAMLSGEVKGGTPPYVITVGSKPDGVGVSGVTITSGVDGKFIHKLPAPAADGCLVLTVKNGDAKHPATATSEIAVSKAVSPTSEDAKKKVAGASKGPGSASESDKGKKDENKKQEAPPANTSTSKAGSNG